jgi:hypothetical protein
MTQSRQEQDRLMEQQRLGRDYEDDEPQQFNDYEDDPNEDQLWNCDDLCVCGHIREAHVSYVDECVNCKCAEFKDSEGE